MKGLKARAIRVGRWGKATARWVFAIGALVNFALAGTRWIVEVDPHLTMRLIAWGLFDLTVVFLFLDRDNPPEAAPLDETVPKA